MKRCLLAGALALAGVTGAHAADRFLVQIPATLDASAPIATSVRNECHVEALVGQHVFAQVARRWPATESVLSLPEQGTDRGLRLTLVSVLGAGGGAWSGPKSMSLRVDVVQGGKPLRSTVLTRQSAGGLMGGMSGTCPIMERIAVALGRDVATWLQRSSDATLPPVQAEEPVPAPPPQPQQ